MWASCSHVNPIPPCSWMFFSAHLTNAGSACVAATATASSNSGVPGSVRAASHVAAVASWVATNMSAAWCLTAWNIPMTRPNCSRTFAYSLAIVTQVAAPPVASAAASRRPSTTAVRRAPARTRSAAGSAVRVTVPTRRVASVFAGHRHRDLVAGGDHEVVAAGEQEQVGEPGAEHEVGGVVEPHRRPGRAVGEAGQVRALLGVAAGGGDHRRGPHRRQEGTRRHRCAERLDHDHQLGETEPGPAVRLRQVQAEPAEVGHLLPHRGQRLLGRVEQRSGLGAGAGALEERVGDAGELEVILGDRDTHESLPDRVVVNLSVGLSTVTGDGSNRPTAAGRQAGAGGMLVPGDERNAMFTIFSVDDHIVEPPDVWSSRVPAKYREAAPHVIEEDGREYWVYEDQRILTMGLNAVAGKPRDQWDMEPARFTRHDPGLLRPEGTRPRPAVTGRARERRVPDPAALRRHAVQQLLRQGPRERVRRGVERLHPRRVVSGGTARPVRADGHLPGLGSRARRPRDRAVRVEGREGAVLHREPVGDGLPSLHDPAGHWDPLFAAAEAAGLPVCMHIGSSGYMPLIDPEAPFTTTISAATASGQLALTNMLLSPIPQRFPDIKLVWSEAGIGWIPAILERADRQVERHAGWAGRLEEKPSDIYRRNMWVCMIEEPIGLSMYDLIGVDRILAETDYPHADTPFPHTQQAYAEVFAGIPADVVEAVSHGNAEALFDWEMADVGLLTSPDVQTWRASLDADPFAAMRASPRPRSGASTGRCRRRRSRRVEEMVRRGALIEQCGASRRCRRYVCGGSPYRLSRNRVVATS